MFEAPGAFVWVLMFCERLCMPACFAIAAIVLSGLFTGCGRLPSFDQNQLLTNCKDTVMAEANPRCDRRTQAHYKWAGGTTADVLLADADPLAIVDGLPWRTFPWYLGQRNYAGTYWCATECSDVNYEWRLELSRLRQSRVPSSSRHCNPTDSVTWASAPAPSSATKTSSARGTGRNPSSSIRRSWSANPS